MLSFQKSDKPEVEQEEHRVILMMSLILLLTLNFTSTTLVQLYYLDSFHKPTEPGFWLVIGNSIILYGLLVLNKRAIGWSWSHLGLARPPNYLQPLTITVILLAAVFLIIFFVQPLVFQITSTPNLEHLAVLQGNLPLLLGTLLFVWLHGAFLQEVIFRAFFINVIDILMGKTKWSPFLGVLFSSLAFGLIHAWQGWGGVILTFIMGIVFGTIYLLNDRRIWPLIFVHGLIDTLTLINIYGMS